MPNEPEKKNKISEALNDCEKARKDIEKTLQNLKNTIQNMKTTKMNFKTYLDVRKLGYMSIQAKNDILTLDEKAKDLEEKFMVCFIENRQNENFIILDEKNKVI